MVVINHCNPHQLNAYPTIPLAQSDPANIQKDFEIGSFARFGNPLVTISIQDRPDFHGVSHYKIREQLDLEDLLNDFIIIDDRTADSHAIWYVTSTEESRVKTASAIEYHNPPITHKGEEFTLWQARFLTQDLPLQWACFSAAVRGIEDDIQKYNHPYDPHNPQEEPFTLGLNFSKKEDARGFIPDAYIKAQYDEIDWSTNMSLRRTIAPIPPAVVRLTEEAARQSGLVSEWMPALQVPREGDTISTQASYDWDSPIWSQGKTSMAKRRRRNLSLTSPVNDTSLGTCQSRRFLGPGSRGFRDLSDKGNISAFLLKDVTKLNTNESQTLPEVA